MKTILKRCAAAALISLLANLLFPSFAKADSKAPEIFSVKSFASDIYVGKKWTGARFEALVKDESTLVKLNKVSLKSTNSQRKDIPCYDAESMEKTISGDSFVHLFYFGCDLPKNTESPDIRFIQFTATDGAGLSSTYTTDIFNTKVNLISGFDPKVIEQSQTDSGKLQLVENCTNYEQRRLDTLENYKTVAKFPAGNPFEAQYKEGKIALANSFKCNLGSDLLTRVSDYEDLIKRLAIGPGDTVNYQIKLIMEKVDAPKSISIICVRGKLSKVVKGLNPKCPKGYKKK